MRWTRFTCQKGSWVLFYMITMIYYDFYGNVLGLRKVVRILIQIVANTDVNSILKIANRLISRHYYQTKDVACFNAFVKTSYRKQNSITKTF